jgi:hypothetical protein
VEPTDIFEGASLRPGTRHPVYVTLFGVSPSTINMEVEMDTSEQDPTEGVRKSFRAEENAPAPGEAAPESKEEREGVSATDTTAATPLGVGESITKGGEELAKGSKETGRQDTGEKGPAARPTGTSTKEDVKGS